MVRRSTWIVLGVFAILVLGLILWQRYGKTHASVEPTPTEKVMSLVFDLGSQSIIGFDIVGADGTSVAFGHDPASNLWMIEGEPAELADSTQIETVASSLAFLMVNTSLTTQPPLNSMGLDKPSYKVTLSLDNGDQTVLNIGNMTPTGSGYYAQVDGEPAMVVGKIDMDAILNLLKTPPLVATYTPTATLETFTPTVIITGTLVATSTPKVTMTAVP